MGKKKKKKQQMHVSAAKKDTSGKQETAKPEAAAKKENSGETVEIRMNFYSAMSMLTTLFSAVSAVLAMVLSGRGFYYVLQTIFDETTTDIMLLNENLIEADFSPKLIGCMYALSGTLVVMVILSLTGTFAAINPRKKPNIVPAAIMSVLGVAAIVLYMVGSTVTQEIADTFTYVPQSRHIGFYNIYFYVLIANAVCAVVNIFGQLYGLKKYKEKGITC